MFTTNWEEKMDLEARQMAEQFSKWQRCELCGRTVFQGFGKETHLVEYHKIERNTQHFGDLHRWFHGVALKKEMADELLKQLPKPAGFQIRASDLKDLRLDENGNPMR